MPLRGMPTHRPKDTEDVIPTKTPPEWASDELDATSRRGEEFFLPGMSAVGVLIPTDLRQLEVGRRIVINERVVGYKGYTIYNTIQYLTATVPLTAVAPRESKHRAESSGNWGRPRRVRPLQSGLVKVSKLPDSAHGPRCNYSVKHCLRRLAAKSAARSTVGAHPH